MAQGDPLPLAVLDANSATKYLQAIDSGETGPDSQPVLTPIHSDPALEQATGAPGEGAWPGTGDGTLVSIAKAEWVKLEVIRGILAGTLSVTGPLTNAQFVAAGPAVAAKQDTMIASLASIVTNTGAALPAGTNLLGKVSIDQVTANANNVHLDATPALPVPVTSSGGRASGAFNRPANTTAYTAGDVVGPLTSGTGGILTFAGIGVAGRPLLITSAELEILLTSIPAGMTTMVLYLYSASPPSAIADNAAWNMTTAGDKDIYLGSITFTPAVVGAGILYSAVDGINRQRTLTTADVYGYLVTTVGYTPTSGETYRPVLYGIGN